MKRVFGPSSKLARSASAVFAILVTALVVGFIDGLATRYGGHVHVASEQPVVIAGR